MSSELQLAAHLKYKAAPELVRTHEQYQAAYRQVEAQLKSMPHVRAPEAILATVMPLIAHQDAVMTLMQADLSAYGEQVMALSQESAAAGGGEPDVIVGLHPEDAETLDAQIDEVFEKVEKVAKGLKEGSDQRQLLEEALNLLADLQTSVGNASLEEDEVPPDEDEIGSPPSAPVKAPEAETQPTPVGVADEGAAEDLSDAPLQIA